MEGSSNTKDSSQCVRVAVNVRPLVTPELLVGCTDCVTIVHGEPQVQIGSHSFTFDYVFGSTGSPSIQLFDDCVAPIVDALFHGYNGTVLAYGQTGSGKTYTMGTNFNGDDQSGGVIPKVMETIFSRVESSRESTEHLIRVSFIEIYKEQVFDLLDPNPPASSRGDATSQAKPSGPARVPIQIRETINGGITLAGVTEPEVRTKKEMATFLLRGSVARATGSTNMNSQSSRSHAIFTIALKQNKKKASCPGRNFRNDDGDDILIAKLHLVDLAGSERVKRTGADGMRFREGININQGLLALGNVISALGDNKKRIEGGHVPYRDSKLTRLLQDSLGGNCKTVMIACVSPANTNAVETLNTLKYANRARNIQNKAIINRDPVVAQMQKMQAQIKELQTELLSFRGDSSASVEELQILKHKISLLEASNEKLQRELQNRKIECEHLTQRALDAQILEHKISLLEASNKKLQRELQDRKNECEHLTQRALDAQILEHKISLLEASNKKLQMELQDRKIECEHLTQRALDAQILEDKISLLEASNKKLQRELQDRKIECEHLTECALDAQIEKDKLLTKIESTRNGKTWDEIDSDSDQELEGELLGVQNRYILKETKHGVFVNHTALEDEVLRSELSLGSDGKNDDVEDETEVEVKELDHSSLQQQLDRELKELDKKLEQKEAEMSEFATTDTSVLKQHFKEKFHELEQEKRNFQVTPAIAKKTEELKNKLANISFNSDESAQKLKEDYLQRMNTLETQALKQAIEHELEVASQVHEFNSKSERQMKEKAKMAKELAQHKEEAQNMKQMNPHGSPRTISPDARSSRQFALENMLSTSSSAIESSSNADNNTQILVDMDISDSQYDWVLKDQDPCDDSGWEVSGRPQKAEKGKSKTVKNLTILKQPSLLSENESVKEAIREEIVPENKKGMCCTCSKSSSCKTSRCECRAKGGFCDKMCGCVPSKCSNREASAHSNEREISQGLASQGALLLQRALSEKPIKANGENERKVLSDIGNTLCLFNKNGTIMYGARSKRPAEKDPNKPKKPASPYLVFMEEFRKKHPEMKSVSQVSKAGGKMWNRMSNAEKAPYEAESEERKTAYNNKLEVYHRNKQKKEMRKYDMLFEEK